MAADLTLTLPRGIDISSYQGDPDFDAVKSDGTAFVFDKATQGTSYVNPNYARSQAECVRVGLKRGSYHYAGNNSGVVDSPIREAQHFLDVVESTGWVDGDMLALDMELAGTRPMGQWCIDWMTYVRDATGVAPLLYTAPGFLDPLGLRVPGIEQFSLWLASWPSGPPTINNMPSTPSPWQPGDIVIWQYSDRDNVNGVLGLVDTDLFVGDPFVQYGYHSAPVVVPSTPSGGPEYLMGFADIVAQKGRDVVGEPLENEHAAEIAGHKVNHQLTTKGQLIWWHEAGYGGFYPPMA